MFPIGCNECGRKTPCSTCQKVNEWQADQARAARARKALEKEAALTRLRQEEAMALGAEPDMGPDVTRARESQLKEGEERTREAEEAEEAERKSKEEEEAMARAAEEEAERKSKEEEEAMARAAEEAERKSLQLV